jgi:hypothetical protein
MRIDKRDLGTVLVGVALVGALALLGWLWHVENKAERQRMDDPDRVEQYFKWCETFEAHERERERARGVLIGRLLDLRATTRAHEFEGQLDLAKAGAPIVVVKGESR